jgi:SAM-dependent methyltransferase
MSQDTAFVQGEADRWFQRNREAILSRNVAERDPPLRLLLDSGLRPTNCLEVGAANGFRLEAIRQQFGCRVTAVDPSVAAIGDGRERFPQVRFVHGLAHALTELADGEFDLVLVSFVLHWVDRARLLRSVAELDRVLADGGHLLVADFNPGEPQRVRYHHLPDQDVWTYKQDYPALWQASCLYRPVGHRDYDHRSLEFAASVPPEHRCAVTLLRKETRGLYKESRLSGT